jgi:hypothetical protein
VTNQTHQRHDLFYEGAARCLPDETPRLALVAREEDGLPDSTGQFLGSRLDLIVLSFVTHTAMLS